MRWYQLAAEQGVASAQFALGIIHDYGAGVPEDNREAMRWYQLAAEQGDASAQFNLGVMYDSGEGVPEDDREAVRWFRLAAEQGNASAQFALGVIHDYGEGVPEDNREAMRWYQLAAEQGVASAQFALGVMYDNGEGVPEDNREAMRWYQLAAEQGVASAQFALGVMYDNGEGVPEDNREAVRWYQLAAEQGDASAQFALGVMYTIGEGVPEDYVQAHKWFNIAASSAEADDREKSAASRNLVAALMTQRQLAEAQRLAREWRPGPSAAEPSPRPGAFGRRADGGHPPAGRGGVSTGSGFFVSSEGHVLTNAHVVRDCAAVHAPPGVAVRVVARDDASDLALLDGPPSGAVAPFRAGRGIRPGDEVVVVGYPLRGMLASEANVTRGNVSALAGPGDDRRLFQMTAPVQPGSSGGPVLDLAGRVVGVTVARLDALTVARATGAIPQNVNFAVGAGTARAFLDAEGVPYETAPSDASIGADLVAAEARRFTVSVECRQ